MNWDKVSIALKYEVEAKKYKTFELRQKGFDCLADGYAAYYDFYIGCAQNCFSEESLKNYIVHIGNGNFKFPSRLEI